MSNPRPTRPLSKFGRKRRMLGWTLLTLGLLVSGVWVASAWTVLHYQSNSVDIRATNGCVFAYLPARGSNIELQRQVFLPFMRDVSSGGGNLWRWQMWNWRLRFPDAPLNVPSLVFPVWPIPLLLWPPAALLLRSGYLARRRANTGSCAKCGYSLAGLAEDAPCPECGTVLSGAERMKAGSEAVRSNGPPQCSDEGAK